jgi:hypothetical protein
MDHFWSAKANPIRVTSLSPSGNVIHFFPFPVLTVCFGDPVHLIEADGDRLTVTGYHIAMHHVSERVIHLFL